MNTNI